MIMIDTKFLSPLAPYMDKFLVECALTHKDLGCITNILNMFDKYLYSIGIDTEHITEEIFENWVDSFRNVNNPKTVYRKRSYIIMLLEYMATLGVECFIPKRLPYKARPFVPYIFTHDEILRILDVADRWRDKCIKPDSAIFAMPLLLRVLYSTGMRVGEALSLKNKDVCLKSHAFRLEYTKNGSERLCPINTELEVEILKFIAYRNLISRKHLEKPESFFLVNHRGNPLSQPTVLARFHKIMDKAGIKGNNPKTGARLHDIRHTACVHVMMKLIGEGYDLYNCIPVISEFMGHKSLFSTEQYLRFTAEMYPQYVSYSHVASEPITDILIKATEFEDEYE